MTEDGVRYKDGQLELEDGRTLAWRWWGEPGGTPILRLQGTPGSRLYRHPNPAIQRELGVRYLMADRPGYGGSTRLPGFERRAPSWCSRIEATFPRNVFLSGRVLNPSFQPPPWRRACVEI